MYLGEPMIHAVWVRVFARAHAGMPKSAIFARPSGVIMILAGLMSRLHKPWCWWVGETLADLGGDVDRPARPEAIAPGRAARAARGPR